MTIKTPLNQRQVEVLRRINGGCPDGRWADFTFSPRHQARRQSHATSGLLDRLDLEGDRHLIADHHTTAFQRHVEVDTEGTFLIAGSSAIAEFVGVGAGRADRT